ncbi:MAG: hypothetical protein AAFX46_05280 [Cyanobacteria bacterium J06636_27]
MGVSLSSLTLPTDKVSANMAPAMFNSAGTIPVSFNQCKNRIHKTANLLFRRIANRKGDGNVKDERETPNISLVNIPVENLIKLDFLVRFMMMRGII